MRVTTIDGGFRGRRGTSLRSIRGGLGSLTSSLQNSEATQFNARFFRFDQVKNALDVAIQNGSLGAGAAVQLEAAFLGLGAERDVHRAQLATLDSPAQLMEWHSTADSIVARASSLADSTAQTIGFDTGTRSWQIGVALVGGALLFGGAAWWLSRRSGRRRRR